jgi:mannose-6-phosphate isomerase-like protein (cupin superfamily)
MAYTVLNRADLSEADGTGSAEFQGYLHGASNFSFIWVDMLPGGGVRLHKHPYEEVFVILEGSATYTVGGETVAAHAGQVIIVPGETPHKFVNTSTGPLRQVDIHASERFITEWLEA